MFKSNGNEKKLSILLSMEEKNIDELLKRMSGFLTKRKIISKRNIADAFFILEEIREKEFEEQAKRLKLISKNPILLKYEKEIIELYKKGHGSQSISNQLKNLHLVSISKSSIYRFLKSLNIQRNV